MISADDADNGLKCTVFLYAMLYHTFKTHSMKFEDRYYKMLCKKGDDGASINMSVDENMPSHTTASTATASTASASTASASPAKAFTAKASPAKASTATVSTPLRHPDFLKKLRNLLKISVKAATDAAANAAMERDEDATDEATTAAMEESLIPTKKRKKAEPAVPSEQSVPSVPAGPAWPSGRVPSVLAGQEQVPAGQEPGPAWSVPSVPSVPAGPAWPAGRVPSVLAGPNNRMQHNSGGNYNKEKSSKALKKYKNLTKYKTHKNKIDRRFKKTKRKRINKPRARKTHRNSIRK